MSKRDRGFHSPACSRRTCRLWVEPGNPDASTPIEAQRPLPQLDDFTDHLVSWRDADAMHRQVALGDVEVGTADTACANLDQEFARTRRRDWFVHQLERTFVDRSWSGD